MAEIYYHFAGYGDTFSCNKIMVCRVVCEDEQEEEQVEKSKSESHRQRRKHGINHTFENGSLCECLGNRMKIEQVLC